MLPHGSRQAVYTCAGCTSRKGLGSAVPLPLRAHLHGSALIKGSLQAPMLLILLPAQAISPADTQVVGWAAIARALSRMTSTTARPPSDNQGTSTPKAKPVCPRALLRVPLLLLVVPALHRQLQPLPALVAPKLTIRPGPVLGGV
jgi:hypothetical protein